jgi:hypothetical protein
MIGTGAQRILMMLLSDEELGLGKGVPLQLQRIVEPLYILADAGAELVLASPEGGFPALGLARDDRDKSEAMMRFKADREARDALRDTVRIEQVYDGDFSAAFCIGDPGRDVGNSNPAGALIASLLQAGKPVAVLSSELDLFLLGAGKGVLILNDQADTPVIAAKALIGALEDQRAMQ